MSFRLERGRAAATLIAERQAALVAQRLRTLAVQRCPVDTGRLRGSIGVRQVGTGHYRVGTNVQYAPFVEFGTRYARAQPFMRPATEEVRRA